MNFTQSFNGMIISIDTISYEQDSTLKIEYLLPREETEKHVGYTMCTSYINDVSLKKQLRELIGKKCDLLISLNVGSKYPKIIAINNENI